VINKANSYLNGLKKWISPTFKHDNFSTQGLCCLSIKPEEVDIAWIYENAGKLELNLCESFSYKTPEFFQYKLTQFVKKHQLSGVNCSWMLNPDDYQLLLTDALPVTQEEFQAAIRWKIKEFLSFPIEEAVIDSFQIPQQKNLNSQKIIMVVVARLRYLHSFVESILASGLKLNIIDIPELALRNICALFENEENTATLVYLKEKTTELIISYENHLYFSRRLVFGLDLIKPTLSTKDIIANLDKFSLEIQRSFDYYQSQWRNPAPTRVLLFSLQPISQNMVDYLSQRLALPIQILNITEDLVCKIKLTLDQQGKYLPIIGGALRDVIKLHETTD